MEPPNEGRPSSRRSSVNNAFRASGGSSSLPRPRTSLRESRISSFRASANQPSYDFITAGEDVGTPHRFVRPSSRASARGATESVRASSRESSKENLAPPDAEEYETQRRRIEELKAELATMRYKVENYEQEKELAAIQQQNDMREVRRRAEDDFKQKQAAEGDKSKIQRQLESIQQEFAEFRDAAAQGNAALEKKARDAEEEVRLVKESLEDLTTHKEEIERTTQKTIGDLETKLAASGQTAQQLEQDNLAKDTQCQQLQSELADKDRTVGDLEAEVLRLKAQTGDADTIAVIKRELADQVQHIRTLEARNSRQHTELTHLRQMHRAVEVVEEEKRTLQRKVDAAEAIESELNEARMQRQRLEDERLAWTAYLQSTSTDDGVMEFDTPESVARALVEERYNSASLMEKLGEVQPQIAERDEMIKVLEADKENLNAQIGKLKAPGGAPATSGSKALARVERMRALANKEVEYLRAQLKTFDAEDETFNSDTFDQQKIDRVAQLEAMIDQYKQEVQSLHTELSQAEKPTPSTGNAPAAAVGSKRARDEEPESEQLSTQLGEANRKRRKLADECSKLQKANQMLTKELEVVKSRLKATESTNKTRILQLNANPTSNYEAIKTATLDALRTENEQLRHQLTQKASSLSSNFPLIPASQLAASRRDVDDARAETASAQKTTRRLKEVWAAKSHEFKEAIFSTLGWTVTFIPNGKMRVESVFYPSTDPDEHENSIVFDGERGTMKVSGGPQSAFARRIADQIQFWVRDKGCIPGFLAALTLEFYDEQSSKGG